MSHITTLDRLKLLDRAIVSGLDLDPDRPGLSVRLAEMGFCEGETLQVCHVAPFGGPMAVEVCGGYVGIGVSEARYVRVRIDRDYS